MLPTAIPFFGVKSLRLTVSTSSTEIQETPHGTENFIARSAGSRSSLLPGRLSSPIALNLQLTIDRIYLEPGRRKHSERRWPMGVFWTPMALLQQTAGYVTTFVAQYFGAREHENRISRLAGHILQYRRRSPFPRIFVRVIRYLHHDRTLAGHA